jgi:hypothetical protein
MVEVRRRSLGSADTVNVLDATLDSCTLFNEGESL